MPFDRHLIASYQTGLQTDVRQWRLMDDAFHLIKNAYVFRGRVRKRFGSYWMGPTQLSSRLRANIGDTPGPLDIPGTGFITLLEIGQIFSVGNDIFTIISIAPDITISTRAGATATIDSTTNPNTVTFTGEAPGLTVYWYPSFPVMGLTQFESGLNITDYPSYAFDPYFAYVFNPATPGWELSGVPPDPQWNGQVDTRFINFFWASNWKGSTSSGASGANIVVMFVTNFQVTNKNGPGVATDDPIWFLEAGVGWFPATINEDFAFLPAPGSPPVPGPRTSSAFVFTARIILPFRNRLILLNTVENTPNDSFGTNQWFPQRCRYSFNGNPLARNAWYEPGQSDSDGFGAASIAAGGGFVDASTDEQITSAEFIKDRLIVYFERSTWELAYTGNENLPFVWNKLNTELGSQSTFSTVAFDKEVLSVGYTGVHGCNGSNVVRIDEIIPDEVFHFDIKDNNAIRIAGVRDYRAEMVYWTIPYDDATGTQLFPNRVLVYNYRQPSWSYNDDTITTFGYFEQGTDITWATATFTWAETNNTWNSNVQVAEQIQVLAGNQEGFVIILDPDNTSDNVANLQITNLTNNTTTINLEVINHNLAVSDWVAVYGSGMTNFDINYTLGLGINNGIYQVVAVIDKDNITIEVTNPVTGVYLGGGLIARVSNVQLQSKQWNPYDKEDRNVYIHKIDFAVQSTVAGEITIDYFPSSTDLSMLESGNAIVGTGILETRPYNPIYYPLEQLQDRLWHPIYFQTDGECIQLSMYFADNQMSNPNISLSDFELEAMILFTDRTTDRLS